MDTRYTSPMPRQVSASYTMLMVPSMAEAGVHGWLCPGNMAVFMRTPGEGHTTGLVERVFTLF